MFMLQIKLNPCDKTTNRPIISPTPGFVSTPDLKDVRS